MAEIGLIYVTLSAEDEILRTVNSGLLNAALRTHHAPTPPIRTGLTAVSRRCKD
jgi:hypothetical protein